MIMEDDIEITLDDRNGPAPASIVDTAFNHNPGQSEIKYGFAF